MEINIAFSNVGNGVSNKKNIQLLRKKIEWSGDEGLGKFFTICQKGGKYDAYFIRGGNIREVDEHISSTGKSWPKGYYRADRYLRTASLIVIDGDQMKDGGNIFDAEKTSAVVDELNVNYAIYTTHSQGIGEDGKTKNKWRLVIPTNREFGRQELRGLVDYICEELDKCVDGKIDRVKEMYAWSQAWFLPLRDNPRDGQFYSKLVDDKEYINVDKIKEEYPELFELGGVESNSNKLESREDSAENSRSGESGEQGIDEIIKQICSNKDGLHYPINKYLWMMKKDGVAKGVACSTVRALMESNPSKGSEKWQERYNDIERSWDGARVDSDSEGDSEDSEDSALMVDVIERINGGDGSGDGVSEEEFVLEWPPGGMGEIARSVYRFSDYPDRIASIVTALGAVAGVCGRRFNINGTGLNIYMTLLAETGQGKSILDSYMPRLLNASDEVFDSKPNFIGARKYTGAKSLMSRLNEQRCFVSVFTEAGHMFNSKSGDTAGLTRTILDLYGKSGAGEVMQPEDYSSEKNSIPEVMAPCFSMINESTPSVFMQAMSGEEGTKTGELTRMTILKVEGGKGEYAHKINRGKEFRVDEKTLKLFHGYISWCQATQSKDDADVIKMRMSDEMFDYLDECRKLSAELITEDPVMSRMYTRLGLKTLKIASLVQLMMEKEGSSSKGALDSLEYITVRSPAFEWAKSLAEYEMKTLFKVFEIEVDDKEKAVIAAFRVVVKLLELKMDRNSRKSDGRSDGRKSYGNKCKGEVMKHYSGKFRLAKMEIDRNAVPKFILKNLLRNNANIKGFENYRTTNFAAFIEYMRGQGYIKKKEIDVCGRPCYLISSAWLDEYSRII